MTEITQLADAVLKMRDAQKEYFRTRSSIALQKSIKLEKDVDDMVKPFQAAAPQIIDPQTKIF
jgi:hypothetical protein